MTGANVNDEKEKVKQLLAKGKEKGSLSYEEIMDSLATTELSPEQIDDIYEQISAMGIKLVHDTTPDLDDLDNLDMDETVEIVLLDTEDMDLSVSAMEDDL